MCSIMCVLLHYVLILDIMFSIHSSFESEYPRTPEIVASMIIVGSNPQAVPTFRVEDRICRLTRLSRSCYKAQMARIAFYVSAAEFSEIVKLAGDVPLSKWCRRKVMERMAVPVNEQGGQDRKKRLPRAEGIPVVRRGAGLSEPVPAFGQAGRKCLCGETWEEHWEDGRCRAERCKCGKFEEA